MKLRGSTLAGVAAVSLVTIGVFASRAQATTVTFNAQQGGNGVAVMASYATMTLTLNTTDAGCSVANPCISVSAVAPTGYAFYDQDRVEGGVLGFNDPGQTLEFLNCVGILAADCNTPETSGPANGVYDGIGVFGFSVDTSAPASNFLTAVITSFSFDILDTTAAFSSVFNIARPVGSPTSPDFASHICLLDSTTGVCATTNQSTPENHAYIDATVPEPTTMVLVGAGLFGLVSRARRRLGVRRP